jgi:hypothetical protein
MAFQTGHSLFVQQIINTPVDITKPIDSITGEMGSSGGDSLKLHISGTIEGGSDHIYWPFQLGGISP